MSGFGDYKCNGADFATISRQNNCWLSSVWGRYLQFLEQNTCGRGLQVNSHDVWGKTRLTLRITYCIGFWCFSCGIQVLFFWITNHLKSWATFFRFPIQFHHHSSDLATWGCYHLSIYIYLIVCCIPFICPRISIILYSIISGAEKSPIVQMSSQSPLLWLIIIRGYILINVYWRWIYNPWTGNPFSTRKGEERAYPLHSHDISPSLSRLYPHCIPSLLVRYD